MARNRIRYFLALLGAFVFLLFFNGYLSFYTFLAVVFLPLLSLLLSLPGAFGLSLSLSLGEISAEKGQKVPLSLTIRSSLPFPCGRSSVLLSVHNTLTDQTQEEQFVFTAYPGVQAIRHRLASPSCGQVVCSLRKGRTWDYLGLFALPLRLPKESPAVLIYPVVHRIPLSLEHGSIPDGEGESYSLTRPGDDPSELFGLREYREGDRLSRVHWKLSQKTGQTLVRELGLPITDHILFLLEPNGSGKETDALLDSFATLSAYLAEHEQAHRVCFWDGRTGHFAIPEIVEPKTGEPVIQSLLVSGHTDALPALPGEELPTGVSHVLYLSCRPSEKAAGSLDLFLPSAHMSVLWFTEDDSKPPRLPAGAELLVVPPDRASETLAGFRL